MGKDSAIEWTDHTFNTWHGCVKVSPGCKHCYAERQSKRSGKEYWGVHANRRWFGDKHWNDPIKWNKQALRRETGKSFSEHKDEKFSLGHMKTGEGVYRERVFCGSMCDVFEIHRDPLINSLLIAERIRLWKLIKATPNLEWLLLTKRIDNVLNSHLRALIEMHPNVRIGITVVNQEEADRDIPKLLKINAPNFLSLEPLLEKIDLTAWLQKCECGEFYTPEDGKWRFAGDHVQHHHGYPMGHVPAHEQAINWVIVGGESGPQARPMHPDWVGKIQQHCRIADVPFFMKQMSGRTKEERQNIPDELNIKEFPE
jgi:protein gp37